jgi:FtsP/CotA-like multicopper oxidase with cupredoxin domain
VTVELHLAQYTYNGVGVVQKTRAFNGGIPGPTIRVKPGDTLVLELHNDLPADGYDTSSLHNEFKVRTPTCPQQQQQHRIRI